MSKQANEEELTAPEAPASETPQAGQPRVMSPNEGYEAARKAEKKQRPDVAEKLYRKILDARPDHGKSAHALALITLKSGRVEEALDWLKKAAALDPEKALIHYHIARVFEKQELYYEAEMADRRAISLDPGVWKFHQHLGLILIAQERHRDANRVFKRALELSPDNMELLNQIGVTHQRESEYTLAETYYLRALAIKPDSVAALLNFGIALLDQDRVEEAEVRLARALSLRPDDHRILGRYGRAMLGLNRHEEARELFQRCLEKDPDNVDALYCLSRVHPFQAEDPLLEKLRGVEQGLHENPKGRSFILNALGKAMHRLGEYDSAFKYFKQSNEVREIEAFEPEPARNAAREITKFFDAGLIDKAQCRGDSEQIPVFVLGTPRSGKSLVEKMLKQHPDVAGLGENKALTFALKEKFEEAGMDPEFPGGVARLDAEQIREVGARYLELIRAIGAGRRYSVNTIPGHVRYAGFIAMALPQARFISIERDDMDVCVQMFCKHFAFGNTYATNLEHLGRFYQQHLFLIRHWREVLGDRLLDVSYEALVTEPAEIYARIAAHCDLAPKEAAGEDLNFNADHIGIAQNYAAHLQPLERAMQGEQTLLDAV